MYIRTYVVMLLMYLLELLLVLKFRFHPEGLFLLAVLEDRDRRLVQELLSFPEVV